MVLSFRSSTARMAAIWARVALGGIWMVGDRVEERELWKRRAYRSVRVMGFGIPGEEEGEGAGVLEDFGDMVKEPLWRRNIALRVR